jgi:hypothetical protein
MENVGEQSTNEETATDSLPLNNGTNDQQAIRVRSENLSRPDGQETNPLLFLPNTPLPPSHLRYLTEKAREYVEEPMQYNECAERRIWQQSLPVSVALLKRAALAQTACCQCLLQLREVQKNPATLGKLASVDARSIASQPGNVNTDVDPKESIIK